MRVFRQQYKDRNGKTKESKNWYVEIKDHLDAYKRIPGFTDKSATTELGRKLVRLVAARISNDPPAAELVRWIEGLPSKLRAKIVELGLIDGQSSISGKRLADHLTDFSQNLKDKGRTADYCQLVTTRVQTILEDCGFCQLNDIAADKVEGFLARLQAKGRSQQTANFYLVSMKGFLNWLVRNRRLNSNPLAHLQGGNVLVDRRLERREVLDDEIRWLLNVARSGETIFKMTGFNRFALYSMALGTGLRASELASLTTQSFDLDSDPPTVRILAKNEKSRRGDTLPLPNDLAEMLRGWVPQIDTGAKLWPGTWAAYKVASKFIQHDLKVARAAWLNTAKNDAERETMKKTDFLSYRDADGQQADFHSLRHTYLSRLGRSGASAKVMQRLARHSTVELTLGRYTHAGLFDMRSAVDKLPPLPTGPKTTIPEVIRATGTDAADVLPSGLPKIPARSSRSVRSGALSKVNVDGDQKEENPEKTAVSSGIEAERVRFELTIPSRICRFSRPVQSATLPPLRAR